MAGRNAAEQLTPEEVRKKWDALLEVINNVASGAAGADVVGEEAFAMGASRGHQDSQLPAARELLAASGSHSMSSYHDMPQRVKPKKQGWDSRHHLVYSTVNHKMQKNIRSYFDRPRDIEAYGTRYDAPLRTTWQLDTDQEAPPPGTRQPLSPSTKAKMQMSKSFSDSSLKTPSAVKEAKWDARHHVLFTKDNHHYHSNLRDYFERPRHLMY
eukprot:TRINITY_DN106587_c0_g1_i1.p1 TRINITY_DN106587_c0_g1~~TRINITY_DN106587_c0_g1_i1.p1  ORF type:complete len:212 (+),score=30.38 TRINITY_DN106587_c0_g1_i1:48-683(+)